MCVCVCVYIQGDSGGICNILGNDSLCDSKQKSSYVHWSDFERLPKYGVVYVCIYIYIYIYIYMWLRLRSSFSLPKHWTSLSR